MGLGPGSSPSGLGAVSVSTPRGTQTRPAPESAERVVVRRMIRPVRKGCQSRVGTRGRTGRRGRRSDRVSRRGGSRCAQGCRSVRTPSLMVCTIKLIRLALGPLDASWLHRPGGDGRRRGSLPLRSGDPKTAIPILVPKRLGSAGRVGTAQTGAMRSGGPASRAWSRASHLGRRDRTSSGAGRRSVRASNRPRHRGGIGPRRWSRSDTPQGYCRIALRRRDGRCYPLRALRRRDANGRPGNPQDIRDPGARIARSAEAIRDRSRARGPSQVPGQGYPSTVPR